MNEAGASPPRGVPAAPARPAILLAEDDDSLRSMLELVLQRDGYDVHACRDGAEARDALAAAAAGEALLDIALLDLRMPGATGTDLLAQIRGAEALRSLYVIAMSGFSDAAQADAARTAGADAFLPKPFSIERLTTTLRAVVSGRTAS